MNQAEDVEVVLGFKRRYRFHSGTLARNSTFFADLLTEANAAKLNAKARGAGVKIRWMVELTLLPCDDFPAGILELVELTSTGERADGRSGLVANENGRVPQAEDTYANYETILYSFYNREIIIDDGDMTAALRHCYSLFTISDYLGCTSLISKPIEVALLKHGQDLFRSIQNMPGAWVQLAHSIRSELIFRECMIHLVADWKNIRTRTMVTDKLREIPGLRSLIEDYHRNLLVQCRNLELAIMASYPGSMATPADDIPIKREAYAKDILVWMALTFFRHWFSQRLMMDKGRHGLDCGYELFKQVGASGDAYMDKSVINQFHTKFPMTKKAINVLENHLFEIKECMKRIVEQHGILKSRCQLDVHRFPVKYLTCIDFKREDFPWIKEASTHVVPAKRAYKPGGNEISRQNLATLRHHQVRATSADRVDEDEMDAEFEDEVFETPTKRARAD